MSYDLRMYPEVENRLRFLERPIQRMFDIIESYIETYTKTYCLYDVPFRLNERTTLSVFAGGVWRADSSNFVLEEICKEKRTDVGNYRGRSDIWFSVSGESCYGEAKQYWTRIDSASAARVQSTLREEAKNAFGSCDVDSEHPMGILFVVPEIHERQASESPRLLETYANVIDAACKTLLCEDRMHVVWGQYLAEALLAPEAYHQSVARPRLDVLFAAPALHHPDSL